MMGVVGRGGGKDGDAPNLEFSVLSVFLKVLSFFISFYKFLQFFQRFFNVVYEKAYISLCFSKLLEPRVAKTL